MRRSGVIGKTVYHYSFSWVQYANDCNEGIIMAFDANVHVGGQVIAGCLDAQDWAGKLLVELIEDEDLVLVNATDICEGVITRVDPRSGKGSTIDLVICNSAMMECIKGMTIDEDGRHKPASYAKNSKKTDHNTILLQLEVKKCKKGKPSPFINTSNEEQRQKFKLSIKRSNLSQLFSDYNGDINEEFSKMMQIWKDPRE